MIPVVQGAFGYKCGEGKEGGTKDEYGGLFSGASIGHVFPFREGGEVLEGRGGGIGGHGWIWYGGREECHQALGKVVVV